MPDLLLELRSEEIPARMQRKAAGDLKKMVTDALVEGGLTYEGCQEYWTPRRLALDIRGVDARSKPVREERKGPRTDAPEQAIAGFLKAAGLKSVAEATVQSDPKKGDFYVAIAEKPGRAAQDIIAAAIPAIIRDFPWPKSMRWGKASQKPGSLRWVRPLQSIVCTFGPETEDPVVVDFEVDGIRAGNVTYGHRFHAPGAITVRRFGDYVAKLEKARVVLDAGRRKEMILADAKNLAFASGLALVEDDGLLEEVAGLVEWPVVLMGEFEAEYLSIPAEVIRLTIRANQKCFVTRGADGALSNRFILVANIDATDGGKEIAYGNGKVVRARLSDALYFWKTDQANLPDLETLKASADKLGLDLKKPLDQRMARLDRLAVTFHAKLGTQGERVQRIAALAEELAAVTGHPTSPLWGGRAEGAGGGQKNDSSTPTPNPSPQGGGELAARARRAAFLCKADLTTEIVGEFPELQGAMGRKYAELQGEHPSVAAAIEDHYKPLGPSDRVPSDPVAIAVALADKLDTLVGFWAIDEKPTGSKDPYALRRAALGVIRILLENKLPIALRHFLELHFPRITGNPNVKDADEIDSLCVFFEERLAVQLRETGLTSDRLDSVVDLMGIVQGYPPLTIVRRVEALGSFLATDAGANLLAGYKRAANILAAEEKKGTVAGHIIDATLLKEKEEIALFEGLNQASNAAGQALEKEDFSGAMGALSALREPVDSFFEKVLVNDEDQAIRANRLALLNEIRRSVNRVADFSKISG